MNGTSVKVYSKAKDGGVKLSEHFTVREFACKDGSDAVFVSPELICILKAIRSYFGRAVTITSGYRTPTHNTKEGGAAYSRHLYGMAADIKVSGIEPAKVYAYAEQLLPSSGGIGLYKSWVHIDVRESKERWKG